jgi:hypothetical protein
MRTLKFTVTIDNANNVLSIYLLGREIEAANPTIKLTLWIISIVSILGYLSIYLGRFLHYI